MYRSSRGRSRTRSSSRSASEPLPVSISASPAVACGAKTWTRPSPPASRANARTRSVRSLTRRSRVLTRIVSERIGSSPRGSAVADEGRLREHLDVLCFVEGIEAKAPSGGGPPILGDALEHTIDGRVERPEPVRVRRGEERRPQEALGERGGVDRGIFQRTNDRLLALDRAGRAGLLRPLDDALMVRGRREVAEDRFTVGREVRREDPPGAVDQREVVAERERQARERRPGL